MNPVVVYASDGNDFAFLKASIFSVKKFLPNAVIYVISDAITNNDLSEVTVIDPTRYIKTIGFTKENWVKRKPFASLYSLLIPIIDEFNYYDRILYLDTDTLVVSKEIERIFEIDSVGHELIAAIDSTATWTRIYKCLHTDLNKAFSDKIYERVWKSRSVTGAAYVNPSVSMWFLDNIRKNDLSWYRLRLTSFWNSLEKGGFTGLSKDFINAMLDSCPILPSRYNIRAEFNSDDNCVIKHFAGPLKLKFMHKACELGYIARAPKAASVEDLKSEVSGTPKIIVYSSDGRDAERLKLSIKSAKKFIGPDIKTVILTELAKYPDINDAILINPMPTLNKLGLNKERWRSKWPYSCMFRLALPLLSELSNVDMILYLDTDVLVMSNNARLLFDLKPCGHEVYGVSDIDSRQREFHDLIDFKLSTNVKKALKEKTWHHTTPIARSYINSGVLVEFLDEIRKNGLDWYVQRLKFGLIELEKGHFHFPDQDFINVMLDVSPSLSSRYNKFCTSKGPLTSDECFLQHFVSGKKVFIKQTAVRLHL